jgi:hypothetical protein
MDATTEKPNYALCDEHAQRVFPLLWEEMIGRMVAHRMLNNGENLYDE